MMNTMRKYTKTILWIVVGAFVGTIFFVWGMDLGRQKSNLEQTSAAVVNGEAISQSDFAQQWEQQYRQISANAEREFSAQETAELRTQLAESMIDNLLVKQLAEKLKISATPQEAALRISAMPAFQEKGKFSEEKYLSLLRYNRVSPEEFEAEQTNAIRLLKVNEWLRNSVVVTESELRDYFRLRSRQIKLALAVFHWKNFLPQVKLAREEVSEYYKTHLEEFDQPEEVRASHILIRVPENAKEEEKLTAKLKLDNLRSDIQKGASFAELAVKNSDDPGSKEKGGDLGYFKRGMMVKPFEDAAFKLKVNELSDLIETPYGFHLIKVTGRHEAKKSTLAEVAAKIEKKLKEDKARQAAQNAAFAFMRQLKRASSLADAAAQTQASLRFFPGVKEDSTLPGIEDSKKILDQVFDLPLGKTSNSILAGDGIYFAEVSEEVYPPFADRLYALEHDSLLENLKKKRGDQGVQDWLKQAKVDAKIVNNIAKEVQEEAAGKTPAQ